MEIHHHESANVTVACSHEDIAKGHSNERKYNSSTQEYVFSDSIRGLNLDPIIEDRAKNDNNDKDSKSKRTDTDSDKSKRHINGENHRRGDDKDKTKKIEIHLDLSNFESIKSSDKKNVNTNHNSEPRNNDRKDPSSEPMDIPNKRNHSNKSKFIESPKKSPEHRIKSYFSESPKKVSEDHEQYLKVREERYSKSARARSRSGGSPSNSTSRPRSSSPLKPQKDQNNPNGNTKRSDSNFYVTTPRNREKNGTNYADHSTEINRSSLKERRYSTGGHVIVSRNKKENEQRPVTAATTVSKASTARSRRSSLPQSKFTKQDLEQYLPRKSFFDCHDKALKEAEQNAQDPSEKLHKKRQSVLERILGEEKRFEANAAVTKLGDSQKAPLNILDESNKAEKIEESPVTAMGTLDQNDTQQQPKQMTKKKSKKKPEGDDEIYVDYTILLHYLKYIRDHPDEYITGRDTLYQANHQHSENRSEDSLIKMAQIYERGHHGEQTGGLLVQAVHEIRPQFMEPVETGINPDESRSEYEKHKMRIDKWIKTISTAQLNKAKELALRELGDEDQALTKWWLALRSCHYIRHPDDVLIRNPLQ